MELLDQMKLENWIIRSYNTKMELFGKRDTAGLYTRKNKFEDGRD